MKGAKSSTTPYVLDGSTSRSLAIPQILMTLRGHLDNTCEIDGERVACEIDGEEKKMSR